MKLNSKPYLDILSELGYSIILEDLESADLDLVDYTAKYSNGGLSRVEIHFTTTEKQKTLKYLETNDLKYLDIYDIRIFCLNLDEREDELCYPKLCLSFWNQGKDDNKIFDISRLTPEIFRKILKIKNSPEDEFEYYNNLIRKYINYYDNIINPIINPVAKLKGFSYKTSLNRYDEYVEFEDYNNNIEIYYFDKEFEKTFIIGVDYITEKLYFYVTNSDIMFDFENIVMTKGRFKELIEKIDLDYGRGRWI